MVLAHDISDGSRTQDIRIQEDITFENMLLSSSTLHGLLNCGFYKPSPIQFNGIPLGKCGFDLLLEAKSGTGKTAVFSVIALEKLDLTKGLQAVVMAPTREIAAQICDVIKQIGTKYEGLVVEVVMGGLSVEEDKVKFKKNVHIVVGSPGRLRHLIHDKHINISSVRLLVLDEADKLLEKSFLADINYIFSMLPQQKQVILSSATYTEETKAFIKKYVNNAHHICPDSNCILLGVEQKITTVKFNANIVRQTQFRFEELLKILSKRSFKQCLVFCNYQARVTDVYKLLTKEKWPVQQLYGQQDQLDRLGALKTLQDYKCRILISTDLAARGIDASNVDIVINFEPPYEWQTYLHRIGRAGRYGSYGIAITILSEGKEESKFKNMLESIKIPLSMGSLWSDNKINLSEHTKQSPQNQSINKKIEVTKEDRYKRLWNKLLGYNIKNDRKIETFENLYKSFEDYKNNIHTNSLDGQNLTNAHLLGKSEKSNDYFDSIDYSTVEDILKSVYVENEYILGDTERFESNEHKISNNKKIVDDSRHSIHRNKTIKIIKDMNSKVVNEDLLNSYSLTENALTESGLPTAFMSSKNKIDVNTLKKNHNTNSGQKQKSLIENNIKNKMSFPTTSDKKYAFENKKTDKDSTSVDSDSNLNTSYINWYRQLKCKIKAIEMSYYIQEMSE